MFIISGKKSIHITRDKRINSRSSIVQMYNYPYIEGEIMNSSRASFTAADTMPVKLLQHPELIRGITEDRIIPPLHVQLIPTNRCNLNCSFCSCAGENRSEEMAWEQAEEVITLLQDQRTEGVTITGGGEPLLYPHLIFNRIF